MTEDIRAVDIRATNEEVAAAEDTQKGRYLSFLIDSQYYAIDISCVTEIISIQDITSVPSVPDYCNGIINLRGKVIPVIDIRARFSKPRIPYDERTCIIVIQEKDITIGLIVDRVAEVLSIDDDKRSPPPKVGGETSNEFVSGIGRVDGGIKLIIDSEALLADGDMTNFNDY
jgi:purine-binding chemotaxis protein CheW